ncbi:hypothetical protein D910_12211 [Dendroctonus ponderosae]|uniref:Uncharacterized protein n=1 Tax=Dendroctonus ponderosae TaxID=77166 RepID=U4ULI9_DENPD|nr:hypothetical protein D910_12211 [Dendroctonus ponderosae]
MSAMLSLSPRPIGMPGIQQGCQRQPTFWGEFVLSRFATGLPPSEVAIGCERFFGLSISESVGVRMLECPGHAADYL